MNLKRLALTVLYTVVGIAALVGYVVAIGMYANVI